MSTNQDDIWRKCACGRSMRDCRMPDCISDPPLTPMVKARPIVEKLDDTKPTSSLLD